MLVSHDNIRMGTLVQDRGLEYTWRGAVIGSRPKWGQREPSTLNPKLRDLVGALRVAPLLCPPFPSGPSFLLFLRPWPPLHGGGDIDRINEFLENGQDIEERTGPGLGVVERTGRKGPPCKTLKNMPLVIFLRLLLRGQPASSGQSDSGQDDSEVLESSLVAQATISTRPSKWP